MNHTAHAIPAPPVITFTPQSVKDGFTYLANHAKADYVRLGALNSMARIMDLFPRRGGSGKPRDRFPNLAPDDPHREIPKRLVKKANAAPAAATITTATRTVRLPERPMTAEERKEFHLHPCGNHDPLAEANNPTPQPEETEDEDADTLDEDEPP